MPYLIHATADELCSLFGMEWLISKGSGLKTIGQDLFGTHFLGNTEQSRTHVKLWSNLTEEQAECYSQGDMSAGNLFLMLNPQEPNAPFIKTNENQDAYQNNIHISHFAFVNDGSELCGLTLCFRKDDPSQWMIGLVKNTQFKPLDRTITLLSSTDLKPLFKSSGKEVLSTQVEPLYNPLTNQIDIPFLKVFIQKILNFKSGIIDIKSQRIDLLLRYLDDDKPNGYIADPINVDDVNLKLLLAVNPGLDLITRYKIPLSARMLLESINPSSEFNQIINSLDLKNDPVQDKNILETVIAFYETELFTSHEEFLKKQILSRITDAFTWNTIQIKMIPLLLKSNFNDELIVLILSEPAYCNAINLLSQNQWSASILNCFQDEDKLQELRHISTFDDEYSKSICLLFWVHGKWSSDEYKEIVRNTQPYPLVKATLLHLWDSSSYTIKQLQQIALNPKEHQEKSIHFHFTEQFEQFNLNSACINNLNLHDLDNLITSFSVLKNSRIKNAEIYQAVMAKNNTGQLLRLFLPQLTSILDLSQRKALIELLHNGIKEQDKNRLTNLIEKITDKNLLDLAQDLQKRLLVTKQLQLMGFTEKILRLAYHDVGQHNNDFAEYPGFDFVLSHCELYPEGQELKNYLLNEGVSRDGELWNNIQLLLNNDTNINKNLLAMVMVFYKEGVLQKHLPFISHQYFARASAGQFLNAIQIKLISFFLNENYEPNDVVKIISNDIYCNAIYYLKERGFTQNIPHFLADSEKMAQLTYINSLQTENQKKLCWVFWAKLTTLSLEQINAIIRATNEYPLLADTLLALDASQCYLIEKLYQLALKPNKHQRKSISHHFASEFQDHQLKVRALNHFEGDALRVLITSFGILKKAGISESHYYQLILDKDNDGKLLRLFLPRLAGDYDEKKLMPLVDLVYTGIRQGLVSQGRAVKNMTDQQQVQIAKKIHDQFVCAKQLQKLHFSEEIIGFAAQENDLKAARFRQIILNVERLCEQVQEQLRQSSAHTTEATQWRNADEEYRKKIYSVAFAKLQNQDIDFKAEIKQVENKLLAIVDPEIKSILHKALIVIANIVILVLSCNLANKYKYKNTGNYWFFTQSPLGEKLRANGRHIEELIDFEDNPNFAI